MNTDDGGKVGVARIVIPRSNRLCNAKEGRFSDSYSGVEQVRALKDSQSRKLAWMMTSFTALSTNESALVSVAQV